jgi:hypothetical protein
MTTAFVTRAALADRSSGRARRGPAPPHLPQHRRPAASMCSGPPLSPLWVYSRYKPLRATGENGLSTTRDGASDP